MQQPRNEGNPPPDQGILPPDQGILPPDQGRTPDPGGPVAPERAAPRRAAPASAPTRPPERTSRGATPNQSRDAVVTTNPSVAFSAIKGLPIVDLSSGARVGEVGDLILSPTFRYLEAFTAAGGAFHRDKTFPARGSTIGVHAVTLPRGAMDDWDVRGLDQMPRASALLNMKLLTESGRILGAITEIHIDPTSGTVMAYEIRTLDRSLLDRLRRREAQTVPANAVTRYGRDAVIIQDALAQQYLHDEA